MAKGFWEVERPSRVQDADCVDTGPVLGDSMLMSAERLVCHCVAFLLDLLEERVELSLTQERSGMLLKCYHTKP